MGPIVMYLLGLTIGSMGVYLVMVRPLRGVLDQWVEWAIKTSGEMDELVQTLTALFEQVRTEEIEGDARIWTGNARTPEPVRCSLCDEPLEGMRLGKWVRDEEGVDVPVCETCWKTDEAGGERMVEWDEMWSDGYKV